LKQNWLSYQEAALRKTCCAFLTWLTKIQKFTIAGSATTPLNYWISWLSITMKKLVSLNKSSSSRII
jgi:hypothetical protein